MLDVQETTINCKEPCVLMGRWAGTGAAVPTPVAKTTRPTGPGAPQGGPMAIARSGVGTLTVTLPNPIGIIQNYEFWVASGANNKNVQITPPVGNVFTLQISYHANGTAVDVAAGEELQMQIICSISQNP